MKAPEPEPKPLSEFAQWVRDMAVEQVSQVDARRIKAGELAESFRVNVKFADDPVALKEKQHADNKRILAGYETQWEPFRLALGFKLDAMAKKGEFDEPKERRQVWLDIASGLDAAK